MAFSGYLLSSEYYGLHVLINQNIPVQQIRRQYLKIRLLLLICVIVLNLLVLFLLQNRYPHLYILSPASITLISSVLYVFSIVQSLSKLKGSRISSIMKEEI